MATGTRDHGWWPYIGPEFAFLLLGELQGRFDAATAERIRPLRVAITAGLLLWFWSRGAYPELRALGEKLRGVAGDVAMGLLGTVIWVTPYLLWPSWRPDASEAFDPNALGATWAWGVLAVRFVGFALVTPIMEELFIRSFLPRVADTWTQGSDFRRLPVGRLSARSFWVVVVVFTLSHVPWEWPVAVAWCALANAWMQRRGNLVSVIVLHATTNASLFLFVCLASGRLPDPANPATPLALWWFL